MLTLRPYQHELLESVRALMRRGEKSILTVAPTGSGKTVLFATIARGAASRKNRVLVLVHRREILEQTLTSLYGLGVVSGQVVAGKAHTQDAIQVGMVQTVARRLHALRRPDLIIVDEAHHALEDNSWGHVLRYWREVPRLGFTATPERLDGRGLRESFSEMVVGPSILDLVEQGFLSYPVVFRPPEELALNYHVKRGDFDSGEQEKAMSTRRVVGDVIEHYRRHMGGLPAVCFCVSIEHSRLMAEQFRGAGYTAECVWGNMPRADRERAIKGLGDGSVQIVTSCDVISEGVDVPVMAGAILLRKTMSLGLYLQQAGRSLRTYPGKNRAVILDHVGNYYMHGHVLQDREWSLDSGRRDPRKEEPPATRTCPRCYGVWPGRPRKCPECGFEWQEAPAKEERSFSVIKGDLIEAGVNPDDADSMAAFLARIGKLDAKKRQSAMWGKAFDLAKLGDEGKRKLGKLAEAIGYRPKWSDFVWREVMKRRA